MESRALPILPNTPRGSSGRGPYELARIRSRRSACQFPSVIPVLLALVGIGAHARVTWAVTRSRGADPDVPAWRRAVIYAAAAVMAWQLASVLVILARRIARVAWSIYTHKTEFDPQRLVAGLT